MRSRAVAGLISGVLGVLVATSAAPAVEKTFVYALYGEPDFLDSAKAEAERSNHPLWLLCDALVNISKDGQGIEPGLAESWTLSPDGLQATMKLRSGVVFHDGTALDGRAVKASFERHFVAGHELYTANPRNTKEQLLRELIEGIHADGLTVVFKLKYRGLHYLSQIDVISPSAGARLGPEFARQPVCSGPFKFGSWVKDRITLVANDRYWRGRPRIDRVVFQAIHEPRAIVDALTRGEVDFTPVLSDPVYFERVRDTPALALIPVPSLNLYYLGFLTDRPPFNNPTLRRALVQGVNVARAVQFLGRGAAVPAKGPLPAGVRSYDPSISQAPYDPEAARDLLVKAGYPAGLTVSLVHHHSIGRDAEVAGAIQSDLRRIGVTVELAGKATYGDLSAAMRAREGHMFLYGWHVRAPYPERILVPLFHSRSAGSTNFTFYSNPTVDRLLDEAPRLPEAEQRRAYAQAQRLIVDDAPNLFLYHLTRMAAVNRRVQGIELNPGALPYDKLVKVELTP
jgi:peptide/nickel transport system substrate-binding protein